MKIGISVAKDDDRHYQGEVRFLNRVFMYQLVYRENKREYTLILRNEDAAPVPTTGRIEGLVAGMVGLVTSQLEGARPESVGVEHFEPNLPSWVLTAEVKADLEALARA